MVKQGSRWIDNNEKMFHVIDVVELNGHTWVHYIREDKNSTQEYSCYIESFISRFRQLPE
jgi:hypothetical protein